MIGNISLKEITKYLFDCDFNDPTFDDETSEHGEAAETLIRELGWPEVFDSWFDYLLNNCPTEKAVVNFANLFFYYGGADRPLRDPYRFISYLYYRVDTSKYEDDAITIFDSIAIAMLSKIGDVSLEKTPDYAPENDAAIKEAVEKWKNNDWS